MTKLSVKECLSGMEKAMGNAKRLAKEGGYLEEKDSPTATFLYAIAVEELSKAYTLGLVAIQILENENTDWKRFWKDFRDHKFKQTGLLKMILVAQNLLVERFDEIKKKEPEILVSYKNRNDVIKSMQRLHEDIERIERGEIEKLKWRHLYVDYLEGRWEIPKVGMEKGFLSKHNIKVYLTDLNTMKKHIEAEIRKRSGTSEL